MRGLVEAIGVVGANVHVAEVIDDEHEKVGKFFRSERIEAQNEGKSGKSGVFEIW